MTSAPLLDLIGRRVRLRFDVTGAELADRVSALARAADSPADEFARGLALDDLYLATACAAGEEDAWAECQRAHFAFIRDFARRQLPDAAARDLADQVIADLWQRRKIARYEGRSSLRTWLGTVVAHAAINAGRSTRTFVPIRLGDDTPLSPDHRVDPPAVGRREAARTLAGLVSTCVAALPSEDKVLLHLYYEQELTLDAMQVALRVSRATLSRRLAAIRAGLRAAIDARARETLGAAADSLRDGVSLDQLEIDLSESLRPRRVVKEDGDSGV